MAALINVQQEVETLREEVGVGAKEQLNRQTIHCRSFACIGPASPGG